MMKSENENLQEFQKNLSIYLLLENVKSIFKFLGLCFLLMVMEVIVLNYLENEYKSYYYTKHCSTLTAEDEREIAEMEALLKKYPAPAKTHHHTK